MLNQPYLLIMFLIPQGIEMTEYTGIILETAEFRKEYDVKFFAVIPIQTVEQIRICDRGLPWQCGIGSLLP